MNQWLPTVEPKEPFFGLDRTPQPWRTLPRESWWYRLRAWAVRLLGGEMG